MAELRRNGWWRWVFDQMGGDRKRTSKVEVEGSRKRETPLRYACQLLGRFLGLGLASVDKIPHLRRTKNLHRRCYWTHPTLRSALAFIPNTMSFKRLWPSPFLIYYYTMSFLCKIEQMSTGSPFLKIWRHQRFGKLKDVQICSLSQPHDSIFFGITLDSLES